jgi:hypothetical protein
MAKVEIRGKITDISDSIIIGMIEKKVLTVKETDGQYPQEYEIDFLNGKGDHLDSFSIGDTVKVQTELRGRKWSKNGKSGFMLSLNGWKTEKIGESASTYNHSEPPTEQKIADSPGNMTKHRFTQEEIDDLPF